MNLLRSLPNSDSLKGFCVLRIKSLAESDFGLYSIVFTIEENSFSVSVSNANIRIYFIITLGVYYNYV